MDLRLAAEFRLDGLHTEAIGFSPTIATTFADRLVDIDARVRRFGDPPPSFAAQIRRAFLIVNQRGDSFGFTQDLLRLVEIIPRPEFRVLRPAGIFRKFTAHALDDQDAPHSLRFQFPGQGRNRKQAIGRLPAGHGHGRVVQDFERQVDASRHGLTDRQSAGMRQRAIADVLKDVFDLAEGRHPHPMSAFATHLRQAEGVAIHVVGHRMATDPRHGQRTIRHDRRAVVRATRAIIWGAGEQRDCTRRWLSRSDAPMVRQVGR